MAMPFTTDEFFAVFRAYNAALWPAQVLLLALAAAAVFLAIRPRSWSGAGISAILAFLWAWLAIAYHYAFFARINGLAYVFAAVSLAGAVIFLWQGLIRRRIHFTRAWDTRAAIGVALIVFALLVYPAWSWYAGHGYPDMPTFGLPCPTTVFTIGMLALATEPHPRSPFVVPVLWSLVGVQAAFFLEVHQDLSLGVAALAGLVFMARGPPGRSSRARS